MKITPSESIITVAATIARHAVVNTGNGPGATVSRDRGRILEALGELMLISLIGPLVWGSVTPSRPCSFRSSFLP